MMTPYPRLLCSTLLCLGACAGVPPAPSDLTQRPSSGAWSSQCVPVWQAQGLPGKRATRYEVRSEEGRPVVYAQASASASLLRHRVRIEPEALGSLRFSWRVAALIANADVRARDTEDSPVRVVLAFDGDHALLPAREQALFDVAQAVSGERPPYATLMYVWDNQVPLETVVPGLRSDRVRKIVVDSGVDHVRQWRAHDRDIAADYRRAFGEAPGALIGVALMTDADNTGTSALAWYGAVCLSGADLAATR